MLRTRVMLCTRVMLRKRVMLCTRVMLHVLRMRVMFVPRTKHTIGLKKDHSLIITLSSFNYLDLLLKDESL